jgi:hypothetical protein
VVVFLAPKLLQAGFEEPVAGNNIDLSLELLGGGALAAFLTTLVLAGILVALAPAYTRLRMRDVLDEPINSFIYGFVSIVAIGLLALLLVVTLVGVLVALPLLIVAVLVWEFGSAIAFLAIADRLIGDDDEWLTAVVLAAVFHGALSLTGVGWLVSFCLGAAGFGAVLQEQFG